MRDDKPCKPFLKSSLPYVVQLIALRLEAIEIGMRIAPPNTSIPKGVVQIPSLGHRGDGTGTLRGLVPLVQLERLYKSATRNLKAHFVKVLKV